MSNLGRGQLLHLRLFIENIEVPVIGAMVSASEGAPAAAQIEVVPSDAALSLLPRTKVELFFLDYDGTFSVSEDERLPEHKLRVDHSKGIADSQYKLLFAGELFTVMYTKSGPGSRSVMLQCLDDSNVWDTSFMYMMRYADTQGESAIAGNTSLFLGLTSASQQFDDILNRPEIVLRQISQRQRALSPSLQQSSGLIGGLFGVLEVLGGIEGEFVGVTAWHTIQEARNRLMDQIVGDSGQTSKALFDNATFESWLTGALGQRGAVISFREIINLINSYIYYAVFPNPVGVYKPGQRTLPEWPEGLTALALGRGQALDPEFSETMSEILGVLISRGWDGKSRPLAQETSGFRTLEDRNRIRRQLGRPPLSRKPEMAHDWGFAMDISIPLGVDEEGNAISIGVQGGGAAESIEKARTTMQKAWTIIEQSPTPITKPEQLKATGLLTDREFEGLATAAAFFIDVRFVISNGNYDVSYGGNWFDRPNPVWKLWGLGWDPVHIQRGSWKELIGEEVLAAGGATDSPELREFYESLPERERLYTQFFRPDVWFVPPPACNIIFPEEVSSFTYTRQMMRETTRLQLQTFNALYESLLLNQVYFAPDLQQVESLAAGGLGSADKAIVYPHEKYTGIIPKLERISEIAFYSRMSEDNRIPRRELSEEDEEGVEQTAETHIDQWAARTAAFNFLTHRYAARTVVCTMRFAPRLAAGFPALIIDRPITQGEKLNKITPTHFLGMVRTLSHSVTQAGGQTSMSMSHARSHKIGDETDDLFSESIYEGGGVLSVQTDTRQSTYELVIQDVISGEEVDEDLALSKDEWDFAVLLNRHLLNGGEIDPVPENWNAPQYGNPPVVGPRSGGAVTSISVTDVPRSTPVLEEKLAPDQQLLQQIRAFSDVDPSTERRIFGSGPGNRGFELFNFSKIQISENLDEGGTLPLEEAIRPPWISDEYSNQNVGKLYREMLGCGSLIDLYDLQPEEGFAYQSITQTVDFLVAEYSQVSNEGSSSSDSFIQSKTQRSYASIPQVIGTRDDPGFYFYSAGEYSNLEGEFYSWMREGAPTQVNINEEIQISGELDPRLGRYKKAEAYQQDLLRSHGLRG